MLKRPTRSFSFCGVALVVLAAMGAAANAQPIPLPVAPNIILPNLKLGQAGQAAANGQTLVIAGHHDAATTEPTTMPSGEVQSLIDQLGDESFPKRQAASDSLLALGSGVAPELRSALQEKLSAEARSAVQGILKQLDDSGQVGGSVITIHAKDQILRKVLEQLAVQSDADIIVSGDATIAEVNQATVSIDLDHASFWDAIRGINDAASISLGIMGNQIRLGQFPGQPVANPLTRFPAATVGPFFIQPEMCAISRVLNYGGAGSQGTVTLRLTVLCEPKLTVVNNSLTSTKIENLDDHDHTIFTSSVQTLSTVNTGRQGWLIMDSFREIPNLGSRLKSVKGSLNLNYEIARKVLDIPDLMHATGQSHDIGGGTLLIRGVSAVNNQFRLDLTYTGLPAPTAGGAIMAPQNNVSILDDSGRALTTQLVSSMQSNTNNVMTWQWSLVVPAASGTPTMLRYQMTTDSRPLGVNFELHDIDIPVEPPVH